MGDAGGDDDWYGYCLDDSVNGVDPLGLETRGIGLGAVLSAFGLTGGGSFMVSEDDDENRVLELSTEYGITNDFGANASGTYQKTNAKSVDQLSGKSTKTGGGISIPTPVGSVGGSIEHVKGAGYDGKNTNASWGPQWDINAHFKPSTGSIKKEHTWTQKVPTIIRQYNPDLW